MHRASTQPAARTHEREGRHQVAEHQRQVGGGEVGQRAASPRLGRRRRCCAAAALCSDGQLVDGSGTRDEEGQEALCALQGARVGQRQLQLQRLPQGRRALAHGAQAAAHQRGRRAAGVGGGWRVGEG